MACARCAGWCARSTAGHLWRAWGWTSRGCCCRCLRAARWACWRSTSRRQSTTSAAGACAPGEDAGRGKRPCAGPRTAPRARVSLRSRARQRRAVGRNAGRQGRAGKSMRRCRFHAARPASPPQARGAQVGGGAQQPAPQDPSLGRRLWRTQHQRRRPRRRRRPLWRRRRRLAGGGQGGPGQRRRRRRRQGRVVASVRADGAPAAGRVCQWAAGGAERGPAVRAAELRPARRRVRSFGVGVRCLHLWGPAGSARCRARAWPAAGCVVPSPSSPSCVGLCICSDTWAGAESS